MNTKLLINGKFVAGGGSKEKVLEPAKGHNIVTVGEASAAQIESAVKAASKAFPAWSGATPKDRATMLLKLADHIEADGNTLAAVESQNTGKPLTGMLNDEIPAIADVFRFFA